MNTNAPRFLIVRLSAIGDVIQSLPIACALKDRFPNAFIAWAVQGRTAALLEGHRALDEVISIPRGWLKSPRTIWQLRRRLHELRFDIALEAQGLSKSAILAWISGAKRRIGFGKPWGREVSPWLNTERVDTPEIHIVERNLMLLRPLGIESPTVAFDLPERETNRTAAEKMIGNFFQSLPSSPEANRFAIINSGAGWPSKLWPTDRFAAVADYLGKRWSLPTLVVWAGNEEKQMAESIVAGSGGWARLAPTTSLAELASLARRATLFLGSDTGPLHLAAAVGTSCVGLYGPWAAKIHGPFGKRNIALQKAFFTGPTRQKRSAPKEYMEAIQVADVCEACDTILLREQKNM